MKHNARLSFTYIYSASLLLLGNTSLHAASGNWVTNANGNWSTATNWSSNPTVPGTVAGDIVNLTNDITGNRTVTINTTSRRVGVLNIGDLNNSHRFTLQASGGASLIFDNNNLGATLSETGSQADTISAPIVMADHLNVIAAGSLTMSGNISETGTVARTLTKSGAGLLILTGANSFTGGVTLAAGQLRVGTSSNVLGTGTLTIQGGTTLSSNTSNQISTLANQQNWNGAFNLTRGSGTTATWIFSGGVTLGANSTVTHSSSGIHTQLNGVITDGVDTRSLTIAAGTTGTVTLGNANTYDGGTTLNSGRLNIQNGAAIGTGTFTFGVAGATIDNTSGGALTLTNNNALSMRSFTFLGSNELNLGTGSVSLNANTQITVNASKLMFGGDVLASTFGIDKRGGGTLTLSGGNSANTGTTTITAGILEVFKMANGGVNSSIGAAGNASGNLRFGSASGVLRYLGGLNASTNRGFTLSSGVGGGATIESSGDGTLSFTSGTLSYGTSGQTRFLTLGGTNTGNNTFGRTIANNGAGATSLLKSGSGTWLVTATNTYTGPTNINSGALMINGSLAGGSAVTVASGALVGGSGTVGGATTIQTGAAHAPGSGIGTQNFSNNLTFASASTFRWELNSSANTYDKVRIGGTLGGSGATFHISSSSAYTDPFWNSPRTWTDVFATTGNTPIAYSGIFSSITGSGLTWDGVKAVAPARGSFQISGSNLTWTAVPEVSNFWVLSLVALGSFGRRRKSVL